MRTQWLSNPCRAHVASAGRAASLRIVRLSIRLSHPRSRSGIAPAGFPTRMRDHPASAKVPGGCGTANGKWMSRKIFFFPSGSFNTKKLFERVPPNQIRTKKIQSSYLFAFCYCEPIRRPLVSSTPGSPALAAVHYDAASHPDIFNGPRGPWQQPSSLRNQRSGSELSKSRWRPS
jgi:hypothetical protein